MLSEPRTIFIQTDLDYADIGEFKISKDAVRRLFNKLYETPGVEYENLELQSTPMMLMTHRDCGHSSVEFRPESIRIEEENPGMHVDAFADNAIDVCKALGENFPEICFVQKCKVHCLVQLPGEVNAVEFLASKVANVYDKISRFGRPPAHFGVRFRFPPVTGNAEIPEDNPDEGRGAEDAEIIEKRGFCTLRFESYHKNLSQIWVEAASIYPLSPALDLENISQVKENIVETYNFVSEECKGFLEQFLE